MVFATFYVKTNSPKLELTYDSYNSAFVIRVQSPPTKGKANKEILKFLKNKTRSFAESVDVQIVKGFTSSTKVLSFSNIETEDDLKALLLE